MEPANRNPDGAEQERPRPKVTDKRRSARAEDAAHTEPAAEGAPPPPPPEERPPQAGAGAEQTATDPVWTPEQEAQARRIADELAKTPGRDWVVDAATGLANIAHVKLSMNAIDEASIAIDAFAGIIDATGSRLGDAEQPLRQVLAQLRLGYANVASAAAKVADPGGGEGRP